MESQLEISPDVAPAPRRRRLQGLVACLFTLVILAGLLHWKGSELIRATDTRRLSPLRTIPFSTSWVDGQFGSGLALDGDRVLVGDSEEAYLFNFLTGSLLQTFNTSNPGENEGFGDSVRISGDHVFSGSRKKEHYGGGDVDQFDSSTGNLVRTYKGFHLIGVSGNKVALFFWEGHSAAIRVFDIETGDLLLEIPPPNPKRLTADLSMFEDKLAILAGDIFIFDLNSGLELKRLTPPLEGVRRIALGDGKVLLANLTGPISDPPDMDPEVALVDLADGSLIHTFRSPRNTVAPERPREFSSFGAGMWLHGDRVIIFERLDEPPFVIYDGTRPPPPKRKRTREEDQIVYIFDAKTGESLEHIYAPEIDFRGHYSVAMSGLNIALAVGRRYFVGIGPAEWSDRVCLYTLPAPQH